MSTPSLMIVEDEGILAMHLRGRFEKCGLNVVGVASTASRAIQMAREHRPCCALMDIKLKGSGDGIELARELFEELGIRVFYMSAFNDTGTRQRAEATSPLGFISKPVSDSDITMIANRLRDFSKD